MSDLAALEARVRQLEDEAAIRRLLMSYGPAADAGAAAFASDLWLADGEYDWDADAEPKRGAVAVENLLRSDVHRTLMAEGVAHFGGPPLINVTDDTATAVNYSLIMRFDEDRFYLWRVSAVRWDLVRAGTSWRVRRRANRLLDETGVGSALFGSALAEVFPDGPP